MTRNLVHELELILRNLKWNQIERTGPRRVMYAKAGFDFRFVSTAEFNEADAIAFANERERRDAEMFRRVTAGS